MGVCCHNSLYGKSGSRRPEGGVVGSGYASLVAHNQSVEISVGGTSDSGCLLNQHSEYQKPTEQISRWFTVCTACKVFAFRCVLFCVVCARNLQNASLTCTCRSGC